ncbi:MAG: YhfZ family protein [Eubacteriales bacterium]|nr:YhfZ family protein [Eubacteriales bacterium]
MTDTLDRNTIYKKVGLVLRAIARDLYLMDTSEQIPTIRHYVDALDVSRRTVQDAMTQMIEADAIRLERRGCKGSYLAYKDSKKLYLMSGWASITGMMPVPLTDGLKSLATAIYQSLSKYPELSFSFAFIQGSVQRAENLKHMPSTFMLCSLSAAKAICESSNEYQIAFTLPNCLYAKPFVLAYRKGEKASFKEGGKLGCDHSSHDQKFLATKLAELYQMDCVDTPYVGLLKALVDHRIDATAYRSETSLTGHPGLEYTELPQDFNFSDDVTTPVVLVHRKDYGLAELLKDKIDFSELAEQQKLILEEKAEAMFR